MSIFSRMKKEREEDYATFEAMKIKEEQKPEQKPAPKPHSAQPRPPQPHQQPVQQTSTPQDNQEDEFIELTDAEKAEVGILLTTKYRNLNKDVDAILMQIDEMKRREMKEVDRKYEEEKIKIKKKYEPLLDRWKLLSDKLAPFSAAYNEPGGIRYEDTIKPREELSRTVQEPAPIRPPEDFKDYPEKSAGEFAPELSKLLRQLDERYRVK